MVKTNNEKYIKRRANMFIEYNPKWEDKVNNVNRRKVRVPYQYLERLITLTATIRARCGSDTGNLIV